MEGLPEDPEIFEPDPLDAELDFEPRRQARLHRQPEGDASNILIADPQKPLHGVALGTLVAVPLGMPLPDLERFWLLSTLAGLEGNRTHAATQLDVALRTIRNKINLYRDQGFKIPPSGRDKEDED